MNPLAPIKTIFQTLKGRHHRKYIKKCAPLVRKINELEKNELLDKKLLRSLTVRVKKFDLETNYFSKKDDNEKKETVKR